MHNIALGITAWCLLSVLTGLAVGRILSGWRRPPIASRGAGLREPAVELEYVAEVLDDGRDRHQPHDRPGCRHAGRDADRGALRAVVVEQDLV